MAATNLCLVLNRGRSPMGVRRPRRGGTMLAPGGPRYTATANSRTFGEAENAVLSAGAAQALREFVANVEDLAGTVFNPSFPALRHLRRYLDIILEPDGIGDDPALVEHISARFSISSRLCARCRARQCADRRIARPARGAAAGDLRGSTRTSPSRIHRTTPRLQARPLAALCSGPAAAVRLELHLTRARALKLQKAARCSATAEPTA